MSHRASIVVDIGFGDAGKGLVTDFLVRETAARTVVRFNGGAQAGHNVVAPDGRHHTFAQLGAGSFVPGVRTHLSRFVVVHPPALATEARYLADLGVSDAMARLTVDPRALVVTPFHQAACRLRELARGEGRHGSCGVGVGEVMQDALAGVAVRVADLESPSALRRLLALVGDHKRSELSDVLAVLGGDARAAAERRVFDDGSVAEAWIDACVSLSSRVAIVEDDRVMRASLREGDVVFEGAQGVLLDEWRGFHPHTTWSTCTSDNALAILSGHDAEVVRVGVLRTHATRHGAGPFPTEDPELARVLNDPHNVVGPWQGAMRFGWLDPVLLRYALEVSGGMDALALTHLDALPKLGRFRAARAYRGVDRDLFDDGGARVRVGPLHDLAHQEALTRALFASEPVYEEIEADPSAVIELVEAALGVPIALTSSGPRASDVRHRSAVAGGDRGRYEARHGDAQPRAD